MPNCCETGSLTGMSMCPTETPTRPRLRDADASTPRRELWFLMSDAMAGGVYTERLDGFARLNDMESCQIPGDV